MVCFGLGPFAPWHAVTLPPYTSCGTPRGCLGGPDAWIADVTSHQTVRDTTGGPDPATVTAVAPIAEDLRQLIALRSRSSLRDRHFPNLFTLLDPAELNGRDRRYAALTALIDEGISTMADQAHRDAAAALLGSGPGRWRTVSQRGGEAAAVFNCGWDAYRRRRTNGTSQLDDTLDALAETLAARSARTRLTSGAPPPDEPAQKVTRPEPLGIREAAFTAVVADSSIVIDDDPTDLALVASTSLTTPSRSHGTTLGPVRKRIVLVAVAGALVLAIASTALFLELRSESVPAAQAGSAIRNVACDVLTKKPGDLPAAADAELRRWAPLFSAAADALSASEVTCAGPISRYNGFIQQQVSPGSGQGIGALIASTDGGNHVIFLRHHEYWAWRNAFERYGIDVVGSPLRRADRADRTQVVELTHGTIVSEGIGQPSFAVLGRVWEEWTRLGGLDGDIGRPLTVVADVSTQGRVQEFIGGSVTIDFVDGEISWTHDRNRADELPADYLGSVLISSDKTAWLVDAAGTRHWVPTDNDFVCATGDASSNRHDNVPAAAIATLKIGAPFRCR